MGFAGISRASGGGWHPWIFKFSYMASSCILSWWLGGSCITFETYSIYVPWNYSQVIGSLDGPCCQSSKVIHRKLLLKTTNRPWDTHSSKRLLWRWRFNKCIQLSKRANAKGNTKGSRKWNIQNKKHEHMPSKYIQRNNREERMKKVRLRISLHQTGSVQGGFNML